MRSRGCALAGLMAAAALGAGAAQAAEVKNIGQLKAGQARFWAGEPLVPTAWSGAAVVAPGAAGPASCLVMQCFDYTIDVADRGARLRVALDQRNMCDQFHLELRDPDGTLMMRTTTDASAGPLVPADARTTYAAVQKWSLSCGFSAEAVADDPRPGRWSVRAIASKVTNNAFRMRAKLEHGDRGAGPVREVLPDLVSTPPYEITFAGGCDAEEIATYSPTRCLRFALGPQNRGDGHLDLRYASVEGVTREGATRQRIYNSDGSISRERDAGSFFWHVHHAHYHYAGFGRLDLYRLDGDRMVHVGDGPKTGACTGAYGIAEWSKFRSAPRNSAPHDCFVVSPAQGAAIGIEAGWVDVYPNRMTGNYVDFGENPDGRYVIVTGTDWDDEILETDESNNASYAVIDVKGDQVTVVERGFGEAPGGTPADDWLPGTPLS